MADLVLVDDDGLIHLLWQRGAEEARVRLLAFYRFQDFWEVRGSVLKSTPVFIDSKLGDTERGEMLAEKLFQEGFYELYLVTGYEPNWIQAPKFLRGVCGKEFPTQIMSANPSR